MLKQIWSHFSFQTEHSVLTKWGVSLLLPLCFKKQHQNHTPRQKDLISLPIFFGGGMGFFEIFGQNQGFNKVNKISY